MYGLHFTSNMCRTNFNRLACSVITHKNCIFLLVDIRREITFIKHHMKRRPETLNPTVKIIRYQCRQNITTSILHRNGEELTTSFFFKSRRSLLQVSYNDDTYISKLISKLTPSSRLTRIGTSPEVLPSLFISTSQQALTSASSTTATYTQLLPLSDYADFYWVDCLYIIQCRVSLL